MAIMLALREAGFGVLVPFGENTRYDLAIDDGRHVAKIQCKTGRLRAGAVRWSMCSTYAHRKIIRRDYRGDVDYFGVYCPETGGVYLIPIEDIELRRTGSLRVDPPKNGQRKFIRFADKYEIGRVRLGGVDPPSAYAA